MTMLQADIGILALRIVVGVVLLYHGWPKIKGLQNTAAFLKGLGFKPAVLWAFLLMLAEVGGGILLILGLLTRAAVIVPFISMLVASYLKIFSWKTPFSGKNTTGWEFDLLILAGLFALFFLGAGAISVDAVLTLPLWLG